MTNASASTAAALPTLCPEWLSANNTAASYGNIIAYPAARLAIECAPYAQNGYTCEQPAAEASAHGLLIDNFWSTNAMDAMIDQPVARLMLNVALLDMADQTILMGTHSHYACY